LQQLPPMNGSQQTLTSRSQSPVKSHTTGSEHELDGRAPHIPFAQHGSAAHTTSMVGLPTRGHVSGEKPAVPNFPNYEIPFQICSYVASRFGDSEFADFQLLVRNGDKTYLSLPVHGIIVAQSPTVASAIRKTPRTDTTSLQSIVIDSNYPFLNQYPLVDAIKHLYGMPFQVSDRTTLDKLYRSTPGSNTPNPSRDVMALALSYVAAGILLQLPSFVQKSIDFVREHIHFDTLNQVVRFAFEEGHFNVPQPYMHTYQSVQDLLLIALVDFLALHFSPVFKLHTGATESSGSGRLQGSIEVKTPTHNPRLSKIRFGEAPAEEDTKPDAITQTVSSVLISLPFPHLERFFAHPRLQLPTWNMENLMRAVVGEREKRRIDSLKALKKSDSPPITPVGGLFPEVRDFSWEERVESAPDHPLGVALTRRHLPE
jgi:hypothetical protein